MTIARATLLFFGYTLVAIALTHPIAWQLSRVPHDIGDPLLSTVLLWWNARRLPFSADWWNGPFFAPATGAVTFSDHRLGESLIATPLQWMGIGPLPATNLTLLATFPLCALAAHWAAFRMTRRHDAALLAGLVYGFNPYRFGHLEHLELLAAFGMPVALGALHAYLEERRVKWMVLFGGSLIVQAYACSYYFLFFLVLLALWIVWFVRPRDIGVAVASAAAVAVTGALISPIAVNYLAVHERYGMVRILREIVTLSADATSIVTAPDASALWGWTSTLNGPERQLFPGVVVVALVVAAVIAALRTCPTRAAQNRVPLALLAAALLFASVALFAFLHGPSQIGPISIGRPEKPFSIAFYAAVAALLTTTWIRRAFAERSRLTFYVLAAAAMFVLALGPAPAFRHQQILYEPPYSWLMRLEIFRDGVRVPARFGMLMVLALALAAALAFDRLVVRGRRAVAVAAILAAAILADSWIRPVPMFAAPAAWPPTVPTAGVASVLELPLGDTTHDVAAMYRSTLTGIATVNGYSGYFPPHYGALRLALDEQDESALDYLAAPGPLMVVVERGLPYARERLDWLRSLAVPNAGRPTAAEVAADADRVWFLVRPAVKAPPIDCGDRAIPILSARDWRGPVDLAPVSDASDDTFWVSGSSQRVGDWLILDLGREVHACSVRLTFGTHTGSYPRALSVGTSIDDDRWESTFDGKLGGAAIRSAVEHPRDAMVEVPLSSQPARFVRLQMIANQPAVGWLATRIVVTAPRQE